MLDANNCLEIDAAWGNHEVKRAQLSNGTHVAKARAAEDEFIKLAEQIK